MNPTDLEKLKVAFAAQKPIATDPAGLEIDRLLSADQRRTVSVSPDQHLAWQQSLVPPAPYDDDFDDLIEVDPYSGDPPNRRSEKEIGRLLGILDSLDNFKGERGNH